MVTRINISLPKETLVELDRAAAQAGTSRSALIVQAVEHFLQEKAGEKLKEKRRKAAEGIDRIREKLGAAARSFPWSNPSCPLRQAPSSTNTTERRPRRVGAPPPKPSWQWHKELS